MDRDALSWTATVTELVTVLERAIYDGDREHALTVCQRLRVRLGVTSAATAVAKKAL